MTSRALVTGGAGFIGSHVADHLIAKGFAVDIIDNLSSGSRDNLPANATFHNLDVTSPDAATLVREGRYDVICHLAAQIDVRKSVADPLADATSNILGALNLLEAVRASGNRTRFVFSSTGGAIYGDRAPIPSGEEVEKDPASPYGIAKLSVEYYMSCYARLHGLETVALRYANVYGPRQNRHGEAGVVAIFCSRILRGEPLTVFGDGKQTRDYVFVEDVARANVAAVEMELPAPERIDSRAFNIGTETETSVLELASTVQHVAASRAAVQHAPARPGEQQRSCVAVAKAARALNWRPRVDLADGLRRTFEFFSSRREAA